MRFSYLFILLAIFYCSDFYSQVKNEDDLKKQAETHFEEEDYNLAYKLYAQLVSLYPKDPDYNYKLGVCMLFTEPDKKKPYSYLLIATKNPADAPKDALFYLARTYHVNYRFDDAIKLYTDYKKIGSASSIKKLQVDREIQACINGKRLLSNITDLVVITKKQLNEADYFKGYDVKDIGGKLLVKPDEYKTAYDKKKKDKSVVYLPKSAQRLYYSSYGENGNTGRDIYFLNKLPNGSWSKPTILPPSINTEFDEDYPFLHPNGKTLYFSSKGFNSMGGYDVFKTTYDDATQTWSKPENLEFPINSPDDDILFVTDSLEKTAFFSTGRYSPYGKLDVLKINTERRPMNFAVVKGTVVKEDASQSVKSKISVKNIENGEIVGTFQAQDNGDYNLELPNGGKFIFTVETPGIPTQSDAVQIPVAFTLKPYKQVISYDKKVLKIINYFDGAVADENYSMMLDQIEKKAKLEINESEPYNNNLLKDDTKTQLTGDENKNLNSVSTTNPTVQTSDANTNKNVTNEQLLAIAKTDAKEAGDEATQLKQEAQDAFGLATQKTAESVSKQKEADDAFTNANAITDVAQKNEELTKANQLKEDARIATNVANTATNLAKKLEVDASVQQKEADLTNQYISQLDAVIKNKNNKEALTKLGEIQKELDDLSKQKNQSSELFTSLKAESELKQQELSNSEKKSNSIISEINSIKNETANLEKDLANESDKSIKENITAQIRELNNEVDLKNKDITTNQQKIETLKNEVDGVNQEIQIAAKILNEATDISVAKTNNTDNKTELKTSVPTANTVTPVRTETIATNNTNVATTNPVTNTTISTDKKEAGNPDQLINEAENLSTKANEQRKEATTKNGAEKEGLIKQAIENEKLAIDKKLEASDIFQKQNKTKYDNNAVNLTELQKLSANTTPSEISQANTLINESKLNFKQAQEIRKEAENNPSAGAKLGGLSNAEEKENEAVAKQEKALAILSKNNPTTVVKPLDEPILSQEPIVAITNTSTNKAEALINESENLSSKAYEQRKEAVTKTGPEKDELLKEAGANEKLAIDKKLEASVLFQKQHNESFDINATNLNELQKLTGNKTSNEISLANMLTNEAVINFKQAQRIRTEAEAYPNGAARLGGLNNAEEKENEALAKQQKALAILSKENPTYKLKTVDAIQSPTTTESDEITKTVNAQIDTYLAVSKSNQNELNTKKDQLTKNPAFNNSSDIQVQNLKLSADNLNNEAKVFIDQSLIAQTPSEKANLLLKANEKEIAAIKALTEANELLNKNSVSSTETNTISTVNTETVAAVNNTSINENNVSSSIITNSVEANSTNTIPTTNNGAITNTNNTTSSLDNNSSDNTAIDSDNNNSATLKGNSVGDETSKLKTGLNNTTETNLTTFNSYTNNEAITLKEQALQKINTALTEDKQISVALENVTQMAANNTSGGTVSQENITALTIEADQLNDEAFAIRKVANTKTGVEKDDAINAAKKLEATASNKKLEAANKQKQLNTATYDANKQSLEDLAGLAKGKNISDLASADVQINEAALLHKQAINLRNEAATISSDAAKLGGYSNAEEKENQAIAKQQALIDIYKKTFPDYIAKKASVSSDSPEAITQLNSAEKSLNTNNQLHVEGLLLLIQANEKEYRSRILSLPSILEVNKSNLKTQAQAEYKKQKDLLAEANNSSDNLKKKELLITASKSGHESINLLNQISGSNPVTNNNTTNSESNNNGNRNSNNNIAENNISTNTNANSSGNTNNNSSNNNTANNNIANKTASNQVTVKIKVEGLEVKNSNAYTAEKPIPIDEKIPDGLVFKVQIGAFKSPLPNNTFKGLSPVIAQTTPSGYIRYMAGNFENYTSAIAVKNDLRNLGYNDAFVVGYYNGKRINLNEAVDKAKTAGQTIEINSNTSAGITANSNVPKNTFAVPPNNTQNATDTQPVEITNELEKMNGLLYTVQIGVYSKQITRSQLNNLSPIYTEKLPSGLYRYTAGIYNQSSRLLPDKRKVVDLGVKDAFVSAYYNAKRIPFAEAQKLQSENNNLKMEPENPIIFSNSPNNNLNTNPQPVNNTTTPVNNTTPSVNAFSNGVTAGPTPTAENGVKTDDTGISYKVQIGAYKNQVPNEVASKFLNIKTWPVKNIIINGLYIYTIGNFSGFEYAKKLRDEAVAVGISDAFITVYKDGKKLYGSESLQYLNR